MRKGIISGLAVLLGCYVLIYLGLTLRGRYESVCIGPSGVKSWGWAPYGFHDETFWRPKMMYLFAPLYIADKWYWHTDRHWHTAQAVGEMIENRSAWTELYANESMNNPEAPMNAKEARKGHENEEKEMRRMAGAARAMKEYLTGKDPKDVSLNWVKAHFGEPHSQTSTLLVYIFDTGLGGNKWEFQLEGGMVKRVIHQSLD